MNKTTLLLLLILTLALTACSGNAASSAGQEFNGQNAPTNGSNTSGTTPGGENLSMPMQVAIGTVKLEGTRNAVTADQAKELLPLWETLQVLDSSDTAATQEKDALVAQIQETMTQDQVQAITALNLTRQDMFSIMQSQVQTFGGTQNNGTTHQGGTSTDRGDFAGGPLPDGGGFPGGGNFQGQRTQSGSNSSGSSSSNTTRSAAAIDPNRIPTPLIQAVIEYLKSKAG